MKTSSHHCLCDLPDQSISHSGISYAHEHRYWKVCIWNRVTILKYSPMIPQGLYKTVQKKILIQMSSEIWPLQLSSHSLLPDTGPKLVLQDVHLSDGVRKLPMAMVYDNTWSWWLMYLTEHNIDCLESWATGLNPLQPNTSHSHASHLQIQISWAWCEQHIIQYLLQKTTLNEAHSKWSDD